MLPRPQALLLDFGGVIADGAHDPHWRLPVADAVSEVLAAAGAPPVGHEAILAGLDSDDRDADRTWFEAESPTQPDQATVWGERVAVGWPLAAREAVAAHAALLSRTFIESKHAHQWQLRPGMVALLADAYARGLRLAVVSNTLCGAVHREFLTRHGLADRFVAQFYSDEEGIRKPNPELARRAVAAVGLAAGDCWFVGDTLSRDVLVARRAGLGAAILMRSLRVEPSPVPAEVEPDAVVAGPVELHTLLATSLS